MRIAIINVGASAFRMYIGEFSGGKEKQLDFLIKPLPIGKDTFRQGFISLETVKKATEILKLFRLKLDEYNIDNYRAVCTSGVREALNKEFFLDYTLLHSGIRLEVLEPSEEIYIKYVGAQGTVDDFTQLEKEGLLFANVASGNVTLNITYKDCLIYAATLPYGSLRLRQMFRSVPPIKRSRAIEEYMRSMVAEVASALEPDVKLRHLLGAGSSINLLQRIFKNVDSISLEQLTDTYERVRSLSLEEIIEELALRRDEASLVVPMLIVYAELLKFVKGKTFSFCPQTFPQTLAQYHSGFIKDTRQRARFKNTLFYTARKYRANTGHAKWVSFFARKLFFSLAELHSLPSEALMALEAAAVLKDVGAFISSENNAENAYHIVRALTLPGIDPRLAPVAAHIVHDVNRQALSQKLPSDELNAGERLTVAKLAVILRMAAALDAARERHIKDISTIIADNIIIQAHTEVEPYLEMLAFEQVKQAFLETFGVALELRIKLDYE